MFGSHTTRRANGYNRIPLMADFSIGVIILEDGICEDSSMLDLNFNSREIHTYNMLKAHSHITLISVTKNHTIIEVLSPLR